MENNQQNNKAPEAGAGKGGAKHRPHHHHRPHKKPEQKEQVAQAQSQAQAQAQSQAQAQVQAQTQAKASAQTQSQPKQQEKQQNQQGQSKQQKPKQQQNQRTQQPAQAQPVQHPAAQGKAEEGKKRSRNRNRGREKEKQAQEAPEQEAAFKMPADISISEIKQIVQNSKRAQQAPVKEEVLPLADASILENVPTHSAPVYAPDEELTEVVGVRFKDEGKVYYFAPGTVLFAKGDAVIVETARGPEYGIIWVANRQVRDSEIIKPLKEVVRRATPEDKKHNAENKAKETEAFRICNEKIAQHGLDMKLVEAQYTFDNSKLLFYFTSAGRVDFRELVKDLASVFRTRIELRQIGIRDEAKLMGGLGACGRPLCCATFLSDFGQVSIKMAKEQSLSLNSSKISGVCGRLMCCLRYEHEAYVEEIKLTPPVDSVVKTPDGVGTVVETSPLRGLLKVKLKDTDGAPISIHRDQVKVLSRPNRRTDEGDEE